MASLTKVVDATQVSNGAAPALELTRPYVATITVRGVAPLLFHAWNADAVEVKAGANTGNKGTRSKKTDDLESYTYRNADGLLGVPGYCFTAALAMAGKSYQDPRSPRKSLMDLCKAGLLAVGPIVSPFTPETREWDYEDRRRAVIQRAGITRVRPAMREGWTVAFDLLVNLPEYFSPELVASIANAAGRSVGLLDFRPTFGRFTVTGFELTQE